METSGIGFIKHLTGDFVKPDSARQAGNTARLSDAEQNMIKENFRPGNTDLTYYKSSGSVNTEKPSGKGNHIDFRV